jgi:hypothetical protein
VDLLVVQLKAAIRRLLDTKGVRGRVLDKVNRYGEIVIGVILERPAPPPHVAHAVLPAEDPKQRDPDIAVLPDRPDGPDRPDRPDRPDGRDSGGGEDIAR